MLVRLFSSVSNPLFCSRKLRRDFMVSWRLRTHINVDQHDYIFALPCEDVNFSSDAYNCASSTRILEYLFVSDIRLFARTCLGDVPTDSK